MGGVAIYLTLLLGAALFLPWDRQMLGMAAGATLMFVAGLVDDVTRAAAAPQIVDPGCGSVSAPRHRHDRVTPAASVVDGGSHHLLGHRDYQRDQPDRQYGWPVQRRGDGFRAGAGCLRSAAGAAGAPTLALLIAGACGGFLIYNFNPARLWMGDCGSLPLGFLMSATTMAISPDSRRAWR